MSEKGRDVAAFCNETKTINAELETMLLKPPGAGNLNRKYEIEQIAI